MEVDGGRIEVRPTGWLAALRDRLAEPEAQEPLEQPAALDATLRDYQRRGLTWLARTTSLGLGCCLADDMGLGKTITLIALHLHRQTGPESAGPTLVVCPTSLMGNWQREIERFAPGTPYAASTAHGGRWTTWPTASSYSPRTAPCGWTPPGSPRSPGAWSSPTRPSM
ncbi:hypothetical protein SHKM778_58910 [Streptomyces sp. KM77-8]|uniref:SNF2 N-terminal domain-containing protein n=1 Tax=Streptomyces haneummycinicus TaxID=3074435 RepID=A0AAT9HPY4_9ACTN